MREQKIDFFFVGEKNIFFMAHQTIINIQNICTIENNWDTNVQTTNNN